MAWLLAAAPADAQDAVEVTGTIVSADTGQPVVAAVVMAGDASAMTDESGVFTLELAPGTYTVQVSAPGHEDYSRDVSFTAGGSQKLTIRMMPEPDEVIVVVGQRTPRTRLETPSPIDVITAEAISRSAALETSQILAEQVPAFNSTHQSISDGTDHINPASLRGLGPDQTLVLINGKRRHTSALLNVNGTFGRGSVSTDLNAIPSSAIKRVEVLRDGASAQYGSDAIAGVINIELEDSVDVARVNFRTGLTASGDGDELQLGTNWGYRVGERGILNLTGEVLFRDRANRAEPWSGQIFPGVTDAAETDQMLADLGLTREDFTMNVGQSAAVVGSLFYNSKYQLSPSRELYSFGGYTYRKGYAAGFFRLPYQLDRQNVNIYPHGYLPEINPSMNDWSLGAGLRSQASDLSWDVSANYGGNAFHFFVDNSLNASLGDASPTSFDAGTLTFQQATLNADALKPLSIKALKSLAIAAGAELRFENYRIGAGDEASYINGGLTYTDADGVERPYAPGAQVFPGFQPSNEVDEWRASQSAYAGVETQINKMLQFDVAGRFEHYSDFGNAVNFKVAGRLSPIDKLSLRSTVSTGFRAPSLHQVYFNNVSTQFVDVMQPDGSTALEPRQVLTANNVGPVAEAFGIPDLEQETSFNLSAGVTARPLDNLSLSADVYSISIDDRIVMTSRFSADPDADPSSVPYQVAEILSGIPDVSAAQFFMNAVDTTTRGLDLVGTYDIRLGDGSKLELGASLNFTRTEVDGVNIPASVGEKFSIDSQAAISEIVFNREEYNRMEDTLPRQRGTVSAKFRRGKLSLLGRARYYGGVWYKPNVAVEECAVDWEALPCLDEYFDPKTVFDADIGYQLGNWRVSVGANNLLNTFPDKHTKDSNISGGRFVYSRRISQISTNGGFYYLRLQFLD